MSESVILSEARRAGQEILALRRPFFLWNLIVWALTAAVFAPVSSVLLGLGVFRGGEIVIGNEDLLGFVLSPPGLAYVILAGSLFLVAAVVRVAGLVELLADYRNGHPPTLYRTIRRLLSRSPVLVRLCLATAAVGILALMPLIAGIAGVYAMFLSDFDINYYITVQPPEWWYAVGTGAAVILVWSVPVLAIAARLLPAVPALVRHGGDLRSAVTRVWRQSRGEVKSMVLLVAGSLLAWVVVRLIVDTLFLWASTRALAVVASLTNSVRILAVAAGGGAGVSLLVDMLLSFAGFSFIAVLIADVERSGPYAVNGRRPKRGAVADASGEHARSEKGELGESPFHRPSADRFLRRWTRPSRAVPLIVAVVAIGMLAGNAVFLSLPDPSEVAVSAHRAGPPPAPENTLSALESAIEAQADLTEIDIQLTADGVPVVVHDVDLMRVAGDPRRIADTRFEDFEDIVQIPDDGSPAAERRLATFGDLLERGEGRIDFMVELKYYGFDPDLAETVVEEIYDHGVEDDVPVMSLSLQAIRQMNRIAPELPLGYVSAFAVGDISRLPVDFLAVSGPSITSSLMRRAAEAEIEVHAWTINDFAAMVDLIDRGIDGLITDDPELAVRVRDEMAELTPAERLLLRFGTAVIDG